METGLRVFEKFNLFGFCPGFGLNEVLALSQLERPGPDCDFRGSLRGLLVPNFVPDRLYSLKPNLNCLFLAKNLRTNSYGSRGEEVPIPRSVGYYRILGVGDSVMFGWGVEEEECYLSIAAQRVSKRLSRGIELINLGIPSYDAIQTLSTGLMEANRFCPDVIVIGFTEDDTELDPKAHAALIRDNTWWGSIRITEYSIRRLVRSGWIQKEWVMPQEIQILEGEASIRDKLADLIEFSRTEKIPLIAVFYDGWDFEKKNGTQLIRSLCHTLNLPFIDATEILRNRAHEKGYMDMSQFWIRRGVNPDVHPNAESHEQIGYSLSEWLITHNMK